MSVSNPAHHKNYSVMDVNSAKATESTAIAVQEGLKGLFVSGLFTGASHFLLTRFSPSYAKIGEPPKRILAAIIILGTFSYKAHMSQALHVRDSNVEAAKAMKKYK